MKQYTSLKELGYPGYLVKNKNVVLRKIGDIYLLVPIKHLQAPDQDTGYVVPGNTVFFTNHVGALIWQNVEDSKPTNTQIKNLEHQIANVFGYSENVKDDVDEFVTQLVNYGFLYLMVEE